MAAGLGFKDFVTGEVLTAADVDGYLMQGVWVFADAAARTAAVTSPQEGNISFLKDTNSTEYYSGSAWVAVGGSVPTSYGLSAGKNAIINGGMDIWQRGTSFTALSASTTYTADRWYAYLGTASLNVTRQNTNDTTNLPNIQYCMRVGRTAGNTNTNFGYIYMSMETVNSIPFVGQQVTLSFYARKGTDYSTTSSVLNVDLGQGTGTDQALQNYTSYSSVGSTNATLTTTWQRFSITGTVASTTKELGVTLNLAFSGTAGANDFFEFTGAQLELGSSATTFSRNASTYQGELAACQRYYFRNTQTANNQHLSTWGTGVSSTAAAINIQFPVTMRTNPTAIEFANLAVSDGVNARTNVSSVTFNAASNQIANCEYNVASGLTQYRPYVVFNQTSTTAYVGFSAEL